MTDKLFKSESAMECKITVEDVLKQIKIHTFSAVVAGGYCRDVFHGVPHKDIDVCMYNYYPGFTSEEILLSKLKHWLQASLPLGVVDLTASGEGFDYDGEGNKRISFVWNLPDLKVDIICWNAKSFEQILDGFDCNLNQFYLPSTVINQDVHQPNYNPSLEESPVYFGDTDLSELVWLKNVDGARQSRMYEKHLLFYPSRYSAPVNKFPF